MIRSVLVTGGAGSMGRVVVARLRQRELAVRVFDLPSASFSGLADQPGVEVMPGDITRPEDLRRALAGVHAIVHLAAVLPPAAERNPELTRRVNVDGTRELVRAVERDARDARFVFSSSVSVYGDTSGVEHGGAGIGVDRPVAPDDLYSRSKAESERLVLESRTDWVVLRVSGVAVPAFQEPPAAWPFRPDQRVEFVHRDDAVAAIVAAVNVPGRRHVLNVAGGPTWRMAGRDYAGDYLEIVGIDRSEAVYQPAAGHFDWYETGPSQAALGFQSTPYEAYLKQLRDEVQRLLAG